MGNEGREILYLFLCLVSAAEFLLRRDASHRATCHGGVRKFEVGAECEGSGAAVASECVPVNGDEHGEDGAGGARDRER